MRTLLLLASCLLLLASCKSEKNISSVSLQTDSTTSTQTLDESTTSKSNILTDSKIQSLSNRFYRSGIFNIEFDSLFSIDIAPDGNIRATGYNGKIRGSNTQTNRDTSFTASASSQLIQTDSTGASQKQEEKVNSSNLKESNKKVKRTPSLTPWIGIGIALALIISAALFFIFPFNFFKK